MNRELLDILCHELLDILCHELLDILCHELVHAIVGTKAGHKGPFKQCAKAIGLTGKMTATVAGLSRTLAPIRTRN